MYRGLLQLYQQKGNSDSIVRYAYLLETAIDSLNIKRRTETVHQMASLYNYHRFQQKADRAKLVASKARVIASLLLLVCIILLLLAFTGFSWYWRKKQSQILRMTDELEVMQTLLDESRAELTEQQDKYAEAIREKAEERDQLQNHINELRMAITKAKEDKADDQSRLDSLNEELSRLNRSLRSVVADYTRLKEESSQNLSLRTRETEKLQNRIKSLDTLYQSLCQAKLEEVVKDSIVVKRMKVKASSKKGTTLPSFSDWQDLYGLFKSKLPLYFTSLT